jgi:hypothetical protein
VGVSGVIRTLQERNLIDVVGRAEGLGRPLLYGTTRHFLEHFGFRSLEDLPRPEELPIVLRERIPLGAEDELGGLGSGDSPEVPDDRHALELPLDFSPTGVTGEPVGGMSDSARVEDEVEDDQAVAVERMQAATERDGDEVFEPDR